MSDVQTRPADQRAGASVGSAIVTGGTDGIGLAIAGRLLDAGHSVVITGRDPGKGDAAAGQLAGRGPVEFVAADAASVDACHDVVAAATAAFGAVSVLVNNAGTWDSRPIVEVDEANWDRTFDVNVKGAFFTTQAVVPAMRERGGGAIVNVASIAGLQGFAGHSVYSATKGAMIALTRSLAVDLAPDGIRVNAVAPGNVETAFNEHLMRKDGYRDSLLARTPLNRNGTPDDIAGAVAFLASSDAAWTCGEVLVVDGGWIAG